MNSGSDSAPDPAQALAEALENMSTADYARLHQIAGNRARLLHHKGPEDLLQEAIARGLAGTRPWPPGVALHVYLANTMRSIADEWRKQESRAGEKGMDEAQMDTLGRTEQHFTPDGAHNAAATLATIEAAFADDLEAWTVFVARTEGYEPAEIQAEFDLTSKQYAAASKRIQRKLPSLKELGGGT